MYIQVTYSCAFDVCRMAVDTYLCTERERERNDILCKNYYNNNHKRIFDLECYAFNIPTYI